MRKLVVRIYWWKIKTKEAGFDISWEEIEGSADGELSADALKSFAGGFKWPWK